MSMLSIMSMPSIMSIARIPENRNGAYESDGAYEAYGQKCFPRIREAQSGFKMQDAADKTDR